MSMFVKKKQILAATLVVALAAAVTVNWYYSKPKTDSAAKNSTSLSEETKKQNLGDSMLVGASNVSEEATETSSNAEYFASARLEQKNVKDEIEEKIEKLSQNEKLGDDEKAKLNSLL